MAQTSVIVATLAAFGALAGLAYLHASRDIADDSNGTNASSRPAETAPGMTETPSAAAAVNIEVSEPETDRAQPPSPQQPEADNVARWVADTQSTDANTRAEAIEALAQAPKARAVPALDRVLESGEPQVDRQIALRSLHTLALDDGDDNGAIREVIRKAIYHNEDEGVTQSAQAVLEDIEAEFAERAQSK